MGSSCHVNNSVARELADWLTLILLCCSRFDIPVPIVPCLLAVSIWWAWGLRLTAKKLLVLFCLVGVRCAVSADPLPISVYGALSFFQWTDIASLALWPRRQEIDQVCGSPLFSVPRQTAGSEGYVSSICIKAKNLLSTRWVSAWKFKKKEIDITKTPIHLAIDLWLYRSLS
jgi:hypothetical protein